MVPRRLLRVRRPDVHQLRHQRFPLPGVSGEQGPGPGRHTERGRAGLRRRGRTAGQWRRGVDEYLNGGGGVVGAGGDDDGKSDGTCLELDGVEIKNSSDQGQDFFWRQSGVMCLIRCVRFAFLWFF